MNRYAFTGANISPEMIEQRRHLARAMMQANNRTPQNVGEGLHAVGRALAARMANRQAERGQMRQERDEFLMAAKEAPEMPADAPTATAAPAPDPRTAIVQALQGGAGSDMLAGGGGADMLLPADPASLPPQMALGPHTMGAADAIGRQGGYGGPAGPRYPDEPMNAMGAASPGMLPQGPAMPPPLPSVSAPDMPSRGEVRGLSNPADPDLMGEAQYSRDFERQPVGKDDRTRQQDEGFTPPSFSRESDGQNFGWAARMNEANRILNELETQGTRGMMRAAQMLPDRWENYAMDDDFERYHIAERNFLAAILRKDTGAAVTDAEFRLYGPMFFPQPGQGQAAIDDLRRYRELTLATVAAGAGGGFANLPPEIQNLVVQMGHVAPEEVPAAAPQANGQPRPTHRFNPATGQIEAIQ